MAKSKYIDVLTRLGRLPSHGEASREEALVALRTKILEESFTPAALARYWADKRAALVAAEDVVSGLNLEIEAVSTLLVSAYETADVTSQTLMDGRSISVQPEPHAQVEDREAFRLWCLANGYERELTLSWQTANAVTKERLLRGEPEPEGVKAYIRYKLILRK